MASLSKKLGIGFLVTLGVVALLATAGYTWLRNSEWWVSVTLFHDDYRAENFRSFHTLFPAASIDPAAEPRELDVGQETLPDTYDFEGQSLSLSEFIERTETTGLLVMHGDRVVHETYYQDYQPSDVVTSFSMAKSVVATLVGLAIEDGHIASVQDPITDYVPQLMGSGYEGVSIHDVLTMSSGVAFNENYEDFFSDVMWLPIRIFGFQEPAADILAELERERDPGTYNNYVSSDSLALGLLVAETTGESVTDYASRRLWQPGGMADMAHWNTDHHGQALTHAFFSATLQDYARLGLLYRDQGAYNGEQVIPAEWVEAAVNPTEPHLQPGDNPDSFWTFGYGYQWWLPEDPQGDFTAIGIWGQYIYVHPRNDVVIVKTSTDYWFDENDHESIAAFRAIADHVASNATN